MTSTDKDKIKFSAILFVNNPEINLEEIYLQYAQCLDELTKPYEFLFLVDGGLEDVFEQLKKLKREYPPIKIIKFGNKVDNSVALSVGFEKAKGEEMATLSAHPQIDPTELGKLFNALDEDTDMAVAHRFPRRGSSLNRIRSSVFNWLIATMTNTDFNDIGCSIRVFKRRVINEINLYGNLSLFLPILASKKGFDVKEIPLRPHKADMALRTKRFGTYSQQMLSVFNLFFLLNFTRKPLRFFGFIGSIIFGVGFIISSYLAFIRLFGGVALANRPLLLLGVLFIVLGIQTISIGLIGEIIIFTHAKSIKEYNIDQILT